MHVSTAFAVLAPQSTGHPSSLPADTLRTSTAMPPLKPAGESAASSLQNRSGRFVPWPPDKERAAPPSAIQMEIEAMLAEQAEKQAVKAVRNAQERQFPLPV